MDLEDKDLILANIISEKAQERGSQEVLTFVKIDDKGSFHDERRSYFALWENGHKVAHQLLDEGMAGDNVGLLLRGLQKEDIERGMVLVKKGSITPHAKFEGEVYVLKKEEGGRHTPFFAGYRPQFYIRTTDVTGQITAFTSDDGSNVEMVMPGDRIKMTGELIAPVAIEQGMRFAIREGGRTIGAGVVSKIIE